MTRRRGTQTGGLFRRFLILGVIAALSGCASLPEDQPVLEQLDSETGITVTRLGRPMELYRETFLLDPAGRFAFLGPFETNQMGKRELYLWVALPVDPAPGAEPMIEVDNTALALPAFSREANHAGLTRSPYKIPTPWSAMYYYKIDDAVVAKLGASTNLTIRVLETTKKGPVTTLFAAPITDSRLKDFASR
jgi:hypothetical protein